MSLSARSLTEVRFAGRNKVGTGGVSAAHRRQDARAECQDEQLSEAERDLLSFVFERQGLSIDDYRVRPLRRRIAAALRSARVSDLDSCLARIQHDPSLADKVAGSLLIGYTVPFRDAAAFSNLREHVLPRLVESRGGLRVWSAACSTGAELYSVALLLAELGCLEQSVLRGSDSRVGAIAEAPHCARAFWSQVPSPFAGLKAHLSETHFMAQARRIEWRVENVFSASDNGTNDLVLCRNLAIYLQPAAALRLWRIIYRSLAPGGIVVTGKAERPLPSGKWWRLDRCTYQAVPS